MRRIFLFIALTLLFSAILVEIQVKPANKAYVLQDNSVNCRKCTTYFIESRSSDLLDYPPTKKPTRGVYVFLYRAWNSKHRKIFNKPFDSKTRYGSTSQIMRFYDTEDIGTGSVLCVYRDLKANRINFVINGKKGMVSFSSDAPDFCFGYAYLESRGSSSEIQVTLLPEIDEGNRSREKVFHKYFFKMGLSNGLQTRLPGTN